jgi:hypothetical protein|tara:strand:- start:442 stop:675 length:234 start_codon:yes stop_codon:yes gene_type:complete
MTPAEQNAFNLETIAINLSRAALVQQILSGQAECDKIVNNMFADPQDQAVARVSSRSADIILEQIATFLASDLGISA